jgi:hypothetical protein
MTTQSRKSTSFELTGPADRLCACTGCERTGDYRAPKSRDSLNEFYWFCLEHVRAYNASWDYYKGMSSEEIESEVRADVSWQRPTWPLGHGGAAGRLNEAIEAELHAFAFGTRHKPAPREDLPAELRAALRTFDLVWPVTLADVKAKYKDLAKRHHPDANHGSKHAEEKLKVINLAYATLRGKLAATRDQGAAASQN